MSVTRVVLDTNILFEGLTKRGGVCGLIIDAWQAKLFSVCISNALAYEYQEVLSRKLSEPRWQEIKPALDSLLDGQSEFVKIYLSWRPMSPDPGDDHVIDCAMNAHALIVTSNIRDFEQAKQVLGAQVMTPIEFLEYLTSEAG
jgi:putative PIN family toxin of toxin-antitoxin system